MEEISHNVGLSKDAIAIRLLVKILHRMGFSGATERSVSAPITAVYRGEAQ
jgi:hypothetical protein